MSSQVDQNQPHNHVQQEQQVNQPKRFCKVHPQEECLFLSTDNTNPTECPLKCAMCLFDQSLNTKHLLKIKQIQQSDENTVLLNWPLPENPSLLERIKQITSQPNSDSRFQDEIELFFKELRIKINDKINEIEEATIQQSKQLWDFSIHLVSEYNRLSQKEVLKHHLSDFNTDPEQLSLKIKETITSVLNSQELIEQTLQTKIEDYSLQVNSVDFEGAKGIMEIVLNDLGRISIFLVDDLNDLTQEHNPDNNLGNGNAAVLYQLATSRLNSVSQEFESNLKNHLLRLQRVYDKTNFGTVFLEGKQYLNLELLDEQEFSQLLNFAELLISSKQNFLPPPPNQRMWSSELVFEFLSNPANQCSPDILTQLKEMVRNISSYFALFPIVGELPQRSDFRLLKDNQIKNIITLAAKMNELSMVSNVNYFDAISPIPRLQTNSLQVLSTLRRGYIFETEEQAEIARIFAQLPILELLPFNLVESGSLINWRFIKTNWSRSSQLDIIQVEKGNLISQRSSTIGQAVSDKNLNNKLMYEITCQFNRPFKNCSWIRIGPIEEQNIHSKPVGGNNDYNIIYNSTSFGANTIIKGNQLTESSLSQTLTEIRFRFCIYSQKLYIFDESLQNIVKANPIQINSLGKYRFGISFCTPGDNYNVKVCNVRVFKDDKEIDSFS